MRSMIKNRKAQLANAMIVIMAIGLSLTAVSIFVSTSNNLKGNINDVENAFNSADLNERYIAEEAAYLAELSIKSDSELPINKFIEITKEERESKAYMIERFGNLFKTIIDEKNNYKFEKKENSYLLTFGSLFTNVDGEGIDIRRTFALEVVIEKTSSEEEAKNYIEYSDYDNKVKIVKKILIETGAGQDL